MFFAGVCRLVGSWVVVLISECVAGVRWGGGGVESEYVILYGNQRLVLSAGLHLPPCWRQGLLLVALYVRLAGLQGSGNSPGIPDKCSHIQCFTRLLGI